MLDLLQIPRGITAIIGSGGKTTLMLYLARALPGRRIVCTTTKIFLPEGLPVYTGESPSTISAALNEYPAVCIGTDIGNGKLGAPRCSLEALRQCCDYLIVEADGGRSLPLKAHLPHEPVIPPGCDKTILVAGLCGLGLPIAEAAHRPERFAALCGKTVSEPVTPADVARVISSEALPELVLLNQMDAGNFEVNAREIARTLPYPVLAGSLQRQLLIQL